MIVSRIGASAVRRPDGTLDRSERIAFEMPAPVRMAEILAAAGILGLYVKPCGRRAWEAAMKKAQAEE